MPSPTDADPVRNGDDGLGTLFNGTKRSLDGFAETANDVVRGTGRVVELWTLRGGFGRCGGLEVQSGAEHPPLSADHDTPHIAILGDPLEDFRDFDKEARRPSRPQAFEQVGRDGSHEMARKQTSGTAPNSTRVAKTLIVTSHSTG